MSSSKPIPNVKQGDTPTLLDADFANKLIDAVNQIRAATISPQGYGKVTVGDKGVVIDISPIRAQLDQLSTIVSAFSQMASGGSGGGGGTSQTVINTINGIISGLQSATLEANCDPVTRAITVSLNITLPNPL